MGELTGTKVFNNLQAEIENLRELEKLNTEGDENIQENEKFRSVLSIDQFIEVKILLSWGGGEDGYKLRFSKAKELLSGVYYMADWGEYKEVPLDEDELDLIYNVYLYGEFPEN